MLVGGAHSTAEKQGGRGPAWPQALRVRTEGVPSAVFAEREQPAPRPACSQGGYRLYGIREEADGGWFCHDKD